MQRGSGSTETDYLNGEICLLGREYDVPTPVNDLLTRVMARGERVGQWAEAELLELASH